MNRAVTAQVKQPHIMRSVPDCDSNRRRKESRLDDADAHAESRQGGTSHCVEGLLDGWNVGDEKGGLGAQQKWDRASTIAYLAFQCRQIGPFRLARNDLSAIEGPVRASRLAAS